MQLLYKHKVGMQELLYNGLNFGTWLNMHWSPHQENNINSNNSETGPSQHLFT